MLLLYIDIIESHYVSLIVKILKLRNSRLTCLLLTKAICQVRREKANGEGKANSAGIVQLIFHSQGLSHAMLINYFGKKIICRMK